MVTVKAVSWDSVFFSTIGARLLPHKVGILRGGLIGTVVGALPGAGSDIAAWISYAIARRGSRVGRKDDDDGAVERIMSASAANNASLGGAYIPATVFGIPGDGINGLLGALDRAMDAARAA